MVDRYYAAPMNGSGRWQIVCKSSDGAQCLIIGNNLSRQFAEQLAEQFQAASDAGEGRAGEMDAEDSFTNYELCD